MRALGEGEFAAKTMLGKQRRTLTCPRKRPLAGFPDKSQLPRRQAGRQLSRLARMFANTRPLSARRPKCRVTCPRRGGKTAAASSPDPASQPPLPSAGRPKGSRRSQVYPAAPLTQLRLKWGVAAAGTPGSSGRRQLPPLGSRRPAAAGRGSRR